MVAFYLSSLMKHNNYYGTIKGEEDDFPLESKCHTPDSPIIASSKKASPKMSPRVIGYLTYSK